MDSLKKTLNRFGPGLITGAADDDPSGIATYSQTGAQFGYSQLWTAVFILPLLIAIQELCARIGAVTGKGIARIIKENNNKMLLYFVVFLVFLANTINIGANLGAIAAALDLLIPVNHYVAIVSASAVLILLQIFLKYKMIVKVLKWCSLFLLAYPITFFFIDVPWKALLQATFIPHIEFNFQFLFIIIGVIGTTISPYLFFWEASQEAEEKHCRSNRKTNIKKLLWMVRIDNLVGMLSSQTTTWFIIAVTAIVLHNNGITDIKTAADAAKAIEPFLHGFPHAGFIAKCIFAVGIIGLGLLSIPVLAGSAAYALGEAFHRPIGLNLKLKKGHFFYSVIAIAILVGAGLNLLGINPIKALVYSAVMNGVIAVPLIFIIIQIGNNKKIMGTHINSKISNFFVWLTFLGMSVTTIGMCISFFVTIY
jgi:NRAMP (natural resistance-associated macrophage protein)-like metal ion transporter